MGFLGKIADCLHLYHAFDSRRICSINLSKGRNLKRKQTVHPANFHSKRHSNSGPFHPSNLKFRVASRCTRSRIREPFLCNNRLNYAGVRAFPLRRFLQKRVRLGNVTRRGSDQREPRLKQFQTGTFFLFERYNILITNFVTLIVLILTVNMFYVFLFLELAPPLRLTAANLKLSKAGVELFIKKNQQ